MNQEQMGLHVRSETLEIMAARIEQLYRLDRYFRVYLTQTATSGDTLKRKLAEQFRKRVDQAIKEYGPTSLKGCARERVENFLIGMFAKQASGDITEFAEEQEPVHV